MRALTLVLGLFAFSLSLPSLAKTDIYHVEEFLHVQFEGQEAAVLLKSLNLPQEQTSGGPGKSFATQDRGVELSCFKRHYNVVDYACQVSFDLRGFSKTTKIKESSKGLQIQIVDPKANQELYEALSVPGSLENGDSPKSFETADEKFLLECSTDKVCSFFVR